MSARMVLFSLFLVAAALCAVLLVVTLLSACSPPAPSNLCPTHSNGSVTCVAEGAIR